MKRAAPDGSPKSVKGSKRKDSPSRSVSAGSSGDVHDRHKSREQASEIRGSGQSDADSRKSPMVVGREGGSAIDPAAKGMAEAKPTGPELSETDPMSAGYHPFNTLQGVYIPKYAREHNATLTFPEKVSVRVARGAFVRYRFSRLIAFTLSSCSC